MTADVHDGRPRSMSELRARLEFFVRMSLAVFPCDDGRRRRRQVADRIEIDGSSYLILIHPGGNLAWEKQRRSMARALADGEFALVGVAVQAVVRIALEEARRRLHVEYVFHPALDWWMVLWLPDAHRRWLREQAPPEHRDHLVGPDSDRRDELRAQIRGLLDEFDPAEDDTAGDDATGDDGAGDEERP